MVLMKLKTQLKIYMIHVKNYKLKKVYLFY